MAAKQIGDLGIYFDDEDFGEDVVDSKSGPRQKHLESDEDDDDDYYEDVEEN